MVETRVAGGWNFDNTYTSLPSVFFEHLRTRQVSQPEIQLFNRTLAKELGLDADELNSDEGARVLSGSEQPSGAALIAQAYAGHQFGNFTMLGDGRAMLIGEQMTPDGRRLDVQLKGSGRTSYSRGGDGLAATGPMLREYMMSEAMHGLGIPTTRSLAVVTTGEPVYRETELQGAVLTRIAASHLRVGTFEYARGLKDNELLQQLADYAIERHVPEAKDQNNEYLYLLDHVVQNQAALIAKWQQVGFIHGVMNTDNMTISGETIDYGPCAFMDVYDPETSFSSIDTGGRYRYSNQPYIANWNLARFAETLVPLLHDDENEAVELATDAIHEFQHAYHAHMLKGMRGKIGLRDEEPEDGQIIGHLLEIMQKRSTDFTNTFRNLTLGRLEETGLYGLSEFDDWYRSWQERLARQGDSKDQVQERMKTHNPAIIPRNHRVEEAIAAAVTHNDFSVAEKLVSQLRTPFAYTTEQHEYSAPPADTKAPYQTYCGT
ncbi:YdiU family protein [Geomicrobium sp. JSM 1781026]|uniref:protein adenylyltransferase SelO n=1 Tax=Geomicrobium sp. JSM 1781026 TaxID=3344580 RepID=UPI0035BFB0FD